MKRFLLAVFLGLLVLAPVASADVPQPSLALSADQVWVALAGFLAPLPMYVVNHYAPWVSERVKWLVQTGFAALLGAIGKLIATGGLDFGAAATWEYIGTAVLAAVIGHNWYKAGDVNTLLKAGSNAQGRKPRHGHPSRP